MYQAAKYLLSLGHKDIIYLEGDPNISVTKLRRDGFEKALSQQAENIAQVEYIQAYFSLENAYSKIDSMIADRTFHATAVCADNDMMALGAYRALTEHGYRIPTDISLIGYDDIPAASVLNLTTIHQPYREMGRTAMMTLLALIQNSTFVTRRNILGTSLIVRNSCTRVLQP